MAKEITGRFTAGQVAVQQIAKGNLTIAGRVVTALKEGLPAGHVVVARWVKPQFSVHRGHAIRNSGDLAFVLKGYTEHHCHNLRFFFETQAPGNAGHRDLFE